MSGDPLPPPGRHHWTERSIGDFWDRVAQTRLTELSFARGAAPSLLKLFPHYLRSDGNHLDFGGGDGDLAAALISAGFKTALYEPSAQRSEAARQRLGGLPGFLGIEDGTGGRRYDVVFCLEVIEHVMEDQLPGFLNRAATLVKPSGHLILTCPNAEDLDLDSCVCPECGTFFHRWQHLRSVTPGWLVDQLNSVGFDRAWLGLVGFDPAAIESWVGQRAAAAVPPRRRWLPWRRTMEASPVPPPSANQPDAVIGNAARIVFVGTRRP
ncbi:class I SAM-dependent methyltransferase [Phaeospirillum tilakii]|uniref:Class I SAM-dependent methyltransferase n=1 Tax=Phaeospirillum tilakii TaxID=741673 RepID=A0ABW5CGM9_9PROT